MTEQLKAKEAGTRSVRRIYLKEVKKALEAISKIPTEADEAVHSARKQLKKARAALRLLRSALGSEVYQGENACLRDAARPLTEVRDAKVLVDTFNELVKDLPGEADAPALLKIRQTLEEQRQQVRQRVLEQGDTLPALQIALEDARERAKEWSIGRKGWSVLGEGLRRTYRNSREAWEVAQATPSAENLHEWRKQVKYLWHQLQMLRPLWPSALEGLADLAHSLADHLGDDHDLVVLRQKLQEQSALVPDQSMVETLCGLIDRRRVDLQKQAAEVGQVLFEEKPKQFTNRLRQQWRVWR